jgi:hypothetical protein
VSRPRACWWGGVAAVCLLLAAAPVDGQVRSPARPRPQGPTPHAGSIEISGGAVWDGGFDLGSADATLTGNSSAGGSSSPYDLFTTDSRLGAGFGFQARLAGYLSRSLAVEGGVRLLRPDLSTSITADAEGAPDETAAETLNQYVFDGSVVWHFQGASFSRGRGLPFVSGGAGYVRDLHEGNELVETGVEYHATAGVKLWFSDKPRRAGIRGEAGVSIRDGGFDFRDGTRTVPIAGVSLMYLF